MPAFAFNFSLTAWLITAGLLIIPIIGFMIKLKLFSAYKRKNVLMSFNLAATIQFIIGVFAWLANFIPQQMNEPIILPTLLSETALCYFTFGLYIYLPLLVLVNVFLFKKMVRKYKDIQQNQ